MNATHDVEEMLPLHVGYMASSGYSTADSISSSNGPFMKPKKLASNQLKHKWLRLDPKGNTVVTQTGKNTLMQRLGVQARDLRLLDAQPASSPPAILCRDRAVVVNLEFIKCIITSDCALLLDSGEPRMTSFMGELQRRLQFSGVVERDQTPAAPSNAHANEWGERPSHPAAQQSDQRRGEGSSPSRGGEDEDEDSDSIFGDECDDMGGSQHGGVRDLGEHMGRRGLSDSSEEMQFELRVLEVVLDYVTAFMEHLSSDLEAVAYPGLDAIVAKVTERRLDRLRTVKSRLARLTSRVETIRELLERLLDDDSDMRDMNLTAKMRQDTRMRALRSMSGSGSPGKSPHSPLLHGIEMMSAFEIIQENEKDKDQVEQLLETYFMNLDNTCNQLQTLSEYIDDTEDYIQFDLDTKRNKLIEYRVLLIIFTFAVTIYSTIYNIFGMNVGLNTAWRNSYPVFLETTLIPIAGSILVTIAIVWYCRSKRILCY